MDSLIGTKFVFANNLKTLSLNNKIGMIADKSYYSELKKNSTYTDLENLEILKEKLNINTKSCKYFIAGTMFIIKASVLAKLQNCNFKDTDFGENVATNISSTLAHALERIFVSLVIDEGYEIYLRDNLKLKIQYYFYKIITNIFSLRNSDDKKHKILTFLGIKLSFKR